MRKLLLTTVGAVAFLASPISGHAQSCIGCYNQTYTPPNLGLPYSPPPVRYYSPPPYQAYVPPPMAMPCYAQYREGCQ